MSFGELPIYKGQIQKCTKMGPKQVKKWKKATILSPRPKELKEETIT
jgi:hypothetical protein